MKSEDQSKWKTLSSEYLFNATWLKARRDKCLKPDGNVVENYYVIEYPEWVTAVALTENEEVLLVRQYRHALDVVSTEIPGGCVDASDKNYEEAIRRELLEETGYEFKEAIYLGDTSPNPSTNANLMHMFLLKGGKLVQEQKLDEHEELEVLLVPLNELITMVLNHEIVQAMHVTTIFYALQKLGKLSMNM